MYETHAMSVYDAIEIMGWGTYIFTSALGRRTNPLCGRAPAVAVEIKNRSSRSL